MKEKELYDAVCLQCSKLTTRSYSTSFSLGIRLLDPSIRPDIYSIYGLVRFADEIVDTFHDYDKKVLLGKFKQETYQAIADGISLNPILQSFQQTVNRYDIDHELIESFFRSMEMDLSMETHDQGSYEEYIVGSAEVVGLMCLTVFVNGDKKRYEELKFAAERLGAAFQKVNFLRDLKHDSINLNRAYFPEVQIAGLTQEVKKNIEEDIDKDFDDALVGIKQLPLCCRLGVFLAYRYYRSLFNKIKALPAERILHERIRINNTKKLSIMLKSYLMFNFNKSWSY